MDYNVMLDPPDKPLRSSGMFNDLREYVQAFEQTLNEDEEVGVMIAAYSPNVMVVTEIGYRDPALFIFRGTIEDKPTVLIQHKSQLNFLLTAIKRNPARQGHIIGFIAY